MGGGKNATRTELPMIGESAMNREPRSAERAALEIAIGTLLGLRDSLGVDYPRTRAAICNTLSKIETLVPDAVKDAGR